MIRWLRQRLYDLREGEYRQQIAVWAPTKKERLKLPKVQALKARPVPKDNVEAFQRRA